MSEHVRATEVDLSGLISVLATHLYSTPLVALRELVQNGHDSVTRRRLEDPAWRGGRITVRGEPATGTVTIEDDGAGLTEPEIHAYLATVGTGYTRLLRDLTGDDGLIGAFGLGFLSAFAVAEEVTVTTTSHREPDVGHRYHSSGGERYGVAATAPTPGAGTSVRLGLMPAHARLADEDALREVLGRYCVLLRVPVFVGDDTEPVNDVPVPWRLPESENTPAARTAFATRFGHRFSPLATFPVTPRQPRGADDPDAVGLLWVQDGSSYDSSDNRDLSVYLRGMLLTEDARDLLPRWAGFVGGVIESARLTPTASREDLQRDDRFRAVRGALAESVVDGLYETARTQPAAWRRILARHGQELLGAALSEERLFDLLADDVPVPTSQGDLTAGALRAAGGGSVHVALGGSGGFEEMLYRALQVPVARGDRYAVLPFLRAYCTRRGCPIVELGSEDGDRRMFRATPEALRVDELAWLSAALADEGEQLVPASYRPANLPLVLVPDREAELKARIEADEADARIPSAALRLARQFTARSETSARARLYLNLDSPAVRRVRAAYRDGHPGTGTAAALLRSVKIIMTAASGEGTGDLGVALDGLHAAVAAIVTDGTASSTANSEGTEGER